MAESMQPFLTVRDLLTQVGELHATCRRRLAAAADATTDLRLKVILSFLEQREQEQLRTVARMLAGDDGVLDCYVQSVPANAFDEARHRALALSLDDCESVAESYRRRERALEECFDQLKDTVGPRAVTVFAGLLDMKRQNQARLREALLDF